jgi:hypothetical protein
MGSTTAHSTSYLPRARASTSAALIEHGALPPQHRHIDDYLGDVLQPLLLGLALRVALRLRRRLVATTTTIPIATHLRRPPDTR